MWVQTYQGRDDTKNRGKKRGRGNAKEPAFPQRKNTNADSNNDERNGQAECPNEKNPGNEKKLNKTRGQAKQNAMKQLKIIYNNINGIKSKIKSIKNIIEMESPAI